MSPDFKPLKRLVFNGLLSQDELRNLESRGLGFKTVISPLARIEETDFSPTLVYNAERMAAVYVAFFCLENSARELISSRLTEREGALWWGKCVPSKVRKSAEKKRDEESKNKYHTARASDLIGYTLFGDLSQVIISNWSNFSDLFPEQSWITSRFTDLELSRNIIMHTNILPELEIERIESITRDWIRQVG